MSAAENLSAGKVVNTITQPANRGRGKGTFLLCAYVERVRFEFYDSSRLTGVGTKGGCVIQTFVAHEGEPAFKGFRVDTGALRAEVIELGGIVTRLEVPDRAGTFANVLLGCPRVADYLGFHPHFNCLVGRYANRMTNARFSLDGALRELDANVPPHHLHGGRDGFGVRVWAGEVEGDAVVLRLVSPDGDAGYPGPTGGGRPLPLPRTTRCPWTFAPRPMRQRR